MSIDDLESHRGWRKSSYSEASDNECVEVRIDGDAVLVRDSKDPAGPVLRVSREEWRRFVDAVRRSGS